MPVLAAPQQHHKNNAKGHILYKPELNFTPNNLFVMFKTSLRICIVLNMLIACHSDEKVNVQDTDSRVSLWLPSGTNLDKWQLSFTSVADFAHHIRGESFKNVAASQSGNWLVGMVLTDESEIKVVAKSLDPTATTFTKGYSLAYVKDGNRTPITIEGEPSEVDVARRYIVGVKTSDRQYETKDVSLIAKRTKKLRIDADTKAFVLFYTITCRSVETTGALYMQIKEKHN